MRLRQLEDLSLGARVITAIGILLACLIALMLLIFLIDREAGAEISVVPVPPPSPWDAHLIELDREALDSAYQDQIKHLFHTWLRDDVSSHAVRLQNGARRTRAAYIQARIAIEKR